MLEERRGEERGREGEEVEGDEEEFVEAAEEEEHSLVSSQLVSRADWGLKQRTLFV